MSTLSLVINARDRATQAFEDVEGKVNSLAEKVESVSDKLKNLGGGMQSVGTKMTAAITAPIVGIGLASLKAAADQEQLMISFTTMLGSADKAKTMLEDLATFAASTPFGMVETQNAAKQLLAFGIAADDIEPTLRQLGDVAAGIGAPIGDLAYLFGTASASGRLMTGDINQFAMRGIPIISSLAEVLGVAESAVRDMASEGLITADHMSAAFEVMTKEGSMFGGLMQKQSESLLGMWSTLQDNLMITLQQVGTELIKALDLNTIIANALAQVESLRLKFIEFIQVNPELTKMGLAIAGVAAVIGPLLIGLGFIVTQVSALGPVITALTGPLGLVVLAIGLLAAAFVTDFGGIRTTVMEAWAAVEPTLTLMKDAFLGLFAADAVTGVSAFSTALSTVTTTLTELGTAGVTQIQAFVDSFLAFEPVATTIETIKTAIGGLSTSFAENFGPESGFGSEAFGQLTTAFDSLKSGLATLTPAFIGLGAVIGTIVVAAFNILASAISNSMDIAQPIIQQLLDSITLVGTLFQGVAEVLVGISTGDWSLAWAGMTTIFMGFYTYFSETAENIKTLMSGLVTFATDALVGTLEALGVDTAGVIAAADSLVAFIDGFTWPEWPGVPEWITNLIAWAWPEVPAIISTLVAWVWPGVPTLIKNLIDWDWPGAPEWVSSLLNFQFPSLPEMPSWMPGFAIGTGFVQKSGVAMVGEDGPEQVFLPRGAEVVNNRDMNRMASGVAGLSIGAINIHTTSGNPQEIANMVIQEINRRSRR